MVSVAVSTCLSMSSVLNLPCRAYYLQGHFSVSLLLTYFSLTSPSRYTVLKERQPCHSICAGQFAESSVLKGGCSCPCPGWKWSPWALLVAYDDILVHSWDRVLLTYKPYLLLLTRKMVTRLWPTASLQYLGPTSPQLCLPYSKMGL